MKRFWYLIGGCLVLFGTSLFALTGCGGTDCGEGTIEQDGECVAEGETPNGEDQCEPGQVVDNGSCVDGDTLCGDNTEFDADSGTCVGTEGEGAGDPVECGDGTELDPNENRCFAVPSEEACGANTAFSSDEGKCLPTAEVCNGGTSFDEDTRLCVSDLSCADGDVIVDNICVGAAHDLAANADVTADGNTNPSLGGDPVDLDVKDMGEQTVFTGTIGEPQEYDDVFEQTVNVFRFQANAGDWFEISVQSTGIPNPAFLIQSEEYDMHELDVSSSVGTTRDKARQVVIPENGTYLLIVLPESILTGANDLIGGDDWTYVGTLEHMETPDAAEHDFDGGNLEGTLGRLDDNFFYTDAYEAGEQVAIDWEVSPGSAMPRLQVWADSMEYVTTVRGSDFVEVPESGELYLIADWSIITSHFDLGYVVSVGAIEPLATEHFTIDDGQAVEIRQDHDSFESVNVQVSDDDTGEIVLSGSLSTSGFLREVGLADGDYTVEVWPASPGQTIENLEVTVELYSPVEATMFSADVGDIAMITQSNPDSTSIHVVIKNADGEVLKSDSLSTFGTLYFSAKEAGDYTVSYFNFSEAPDEQEVEDLEVDVDFLDTIEVDTITVGADDEGDVIEVAQSNDGNSDVGLLITDDEGEQLIFESSFGAEGTTTGMARIIGVEEGEYSVSLFSSDDEFDVDDYDVTTTVITPTPITDLDETQSGRSNDSSHAEQSFYLLELSETATHEVTLHHTGNGEDDSAGWARLLIYGLGNDLLQRTDPYIVSGSTSIEMEFEADTPYIIRVGNDEIFGAVFDFDYELTFD